MRDKGYNVVVQEKGKSDLVEKLRSQKSDFDLISEIEEVIGKPGRRF